MIAPCAWTKLKVEFSSLIIDLGILWKIILIGAFGLGLSFRITISELLITSSLSCSLRLFKGELSTHTAFLD